MSKVTVFKVKMYDISTDGFTISRRMATLTGAARMHGEVVEGTQVEIDQSQLEPGAEWTPRGFDPKANGGFQTQVKT